MQLTDMPTTECHALLQQAHVGRLACCAEDQPYVVPVSFACEDNWIYGFSMPGRKIDILRRNPAAALLVEDYTETSWRSVLVQGRFEALAEEGETAVLWQRAWRLISRLPNWWEPGALKPQALPLSTHSPHLFYRIQILSVSGRHFWPARES